jgi:hypothetical protein
MIPEAERENEKNLSSQEIEPFRAYIYPEAARVSGVSEGSLRRALDAGFLKAHRGQRGPKIVFLGQNLLRWIEKGRQTGRTSADLRAEIKSGSAA